MGKILSISKLKSHDKYFGLLRVHIGERIELKKNLYRMLHISSSWKHRLRDNFRKISPRMILMSKFSHSCGRNFVAKTPHHREGGERGLWQATQQLLTLGYVRKHSPRVFVLRLTL